jgi:protocatechuate 3,4-dioxygenase beta subunit
MGYAEDRPLHIVAAVNAENFEIHLVTVYIPDDSIWMDDYRRRK